MNCHGTSLRIERALLINIAALLGAVFFFRHQVFSGGELLIGDEADGLLILAIIEHWFRVFSGLDSWMSPNWFYPITGTLGYSDAFFVYGIIHSFFRLFGLDSFASIQLTLVTLYLTGFAGTYLLLSRKVKLPWYLALIGALLFCSGHWIYKASANTHLQLLFTWLSPWLFICVWSWFEALLGENRRQAMRWGIATVVCFSLFLYTAFYIAWFIGIFLGIFVLVAAGAWTATKGPKSTWDLLRDCLRTHGLTLTGAAALFLVLNIPFFLTYLPALRSSGGQPYSETLNTLPRFLDFINTGSGNWIWGWITNTFNLRSVPYAHELQYGYPLILMCLFIGGILWLGKQWQSNPTIGKIESLLLLTGTTVVICWILMLNFYDSSLWKLIHAAVPGGSAVRAVSRFQLILSLPVLTLVLWMIHTLIQSKLRANRFPLFACILLIFLPLEMINSEVNARVSKLEIREFIAAAPSPPSDIRTFYLLPDSVNDYNHFKGNMTAMHLAQAINVPTLNGYSGLIPPDWNLQNIHAWDYFQHLDNWLSVHNLTEGIYAYNHVNRSWVKHRSGQQNAPLAHYDFHSLPPSVQLISGWSGWEPWGIWTEGYQVEIQLDLAAHSFDVSSVRLTAGAFVNKKVSSQRIFIFINDDYLMEVRADINSSRVNVQIPAKPDDKGLMRIRLLLPDAHSPHFAGTVPEDKRQLGLGFNTISLY
jgi:hypothetical protein